MKIKINITEEEFRKDGREEIKKKGKFVALVPTMKSEVQFQAFLGVSEVSMITASRATETVYSMYCLPAVCKPPFYHRKGRANI